MCAATMISRAVALVAKIALNAIRLRRGPSNRTFARDSVPGEGAGELEPDSPASVATPCLFVGRPLPEKHTPMTAFVAGPALNGIRCRWTGSLLVLLLAAAACQPVPDPTAEQDREAPPTADLSSGETDSLASDARADDASSVRPGRILADGTIIADTFDVRYQLSGETLTVALNTDLPDQTILDVHVSRTYRKQGGSEDYPLDYFGQQSTVGEWRRSHTIRIDNAAWRAELEDVASAGEPFEVASIGPDIELSLTVPINQEEPYQEGNQNLRGRAVTLSTWGRIVRRELSIPDPLAAAPQSAGGTR